MKLFVNGLAPTSLSVVIWRSQLIRVQKVTRSAFIVNSNFLSIYPTFATWWVLSSYSRYRVQISTSHLICHLQDASEITDPNSLKGCVSYLKLNLARNAQPHTGPYFSVVLFRPIRRSRLRFLPCNWFCFSVSVARSNLMNVSLVFVSFVSFATVGRDSTTSFPTSMTTNS